MKLYRVKRTGHTNITVHVTAYDVMDALEAALRYISDADRPDVYTAEEIRAKREKALNDIASIEMIADCGAIVATPGHPLV